jgi:hypothetical protein
MTFQSKFVFLFLSLLALRRVCVCVAVVTAATYCLVRPLFLFPIEGVTSRPGGPDALEVSK